MKRTVACSVCALTVLFFAGCSQADRRDADAHAAEAREKAHDAAERAGDDARKLGNEANGEAHKLDQNLKQAFDNKAPIVQNSPDEAEQKLHHAAEMVKDKTIEAKRKIDDAADSHQ